MSEQQEDKIRASVRVAMEDDFQPKHKDDTPLIPKQEEENAPSEELEEKKDTETPPKIEENNSGDIEKSTDEDKTKNEVVSEPSVNIYESLSEISNGSIKSEDDFKGIIEKANQYTDLESKHTSAVAELEALKKKNPFANEYLEKLNQLYLSGADADQINRFNRINQLGNIDALDSRSAVKWQLIHKFNLTESEAETKLKSTYKSDDTLFSEDEIAASNIDLKIAADQAKKYLKNQQASYEVKPETIPAATEPDTEAKETPEQALLKKQEYEAKVSPIVQTIEQELPSYFSKVNTNGQKDDKAITIDLPIPAEVQKHIGSLVKEFAVNNQLDPSKSDHVESMKTYSANLAKMIMFDAWIIDASNKREEAIMAKFHNPSTIDRGQNNPEAPAKTKEAAAASMVAKTM